MKISRGRFVRTDIWREGEYLDLWSVPHFLSGIMTALGLYLLNFRGISAFVIAFLIFVVYEMFEVIAKIEETRMNRALDVVVGMVSFAPAFFLSAGFSQTQLWFTFSAVTILDGTLSYFGWLASKKASVLEENVRREFELERAKMKERRDRFRERFRLQKSRMRKRWYERKRKDATFSPK
ncbi:hypothetical protein HY969_00170 [Candidatus Kaiserbacteria bacterium]|nr:hypothetical protein [Candidatus Kaiserbacteria bacterium]